MNNSVWNETISKALTEEYSNSAVCVMPQTPHIFSQRHETRMADFFAGLPAYTRAHQNCAQKARVHRTMSIAAVIAALGIGCTMAVSSDDSPFSRFHITYSDALSTFESIAPAQKGTYPETIEDTYVITCDLPGFEIDDQYTSDHFCTVIYSDDNKHDIYFDQSTLGESFGINTEDSNPIEIEFGDGQKAIYFYTNQKYDNLIWENDGYIFTLSANIGKDPLIHIAESIQKAD
ncbi:DUF4367 domain-containing protein [Ruminococcus sp.]|uniref:DUF4367 domain-containing protein n=1 Tax=Ruminococcus sp. TaxID=41978 RepID=UPI0025F96873|nr:DUF4367 domain-containing protein [Ruminococcus sp.]